MPASMRQPPAVDTTRRQIVEAAQHLLTTAGPESLTVRRIADRAGCSTMGLYTHFGGKDGVVDALFAEGFRRLGSAMDAVARTDDPLRDLQGCCRAYRTFAMANPTHYLVMFERHVPGFEPSAESMVEAHNTLVLLQTRVQRCIDVGAIDRGHGDSESIAYSVWATGHGIVSLELHRINEATDYQARYEATTRTLFSGLTAAPKDL